MRVSVGVGLALLLAATGRVSAQGAKNLTVVGQVFLPGRVAAADVPVGLYCTANKGCIGFRVPGRTRSTPRGVYALADSANDFGRLYVIYDGTDPGLTADPVAVDIDCAAEPCVVFAGDLMLRSLPPANQPQQAAAFIETVARNHDVKVAARVLTENEARQAVAQRAAYVAGITSPPTAQAAYVAQVVDSFKAVSKSKAGSAAVSAPAILEHPEYRRTRDIRIGPDDLLHPEKLSPDQFHKLLITPHEQLPREAIDPRPLGKLLEEHAQEKGPVSIGVASPAGPIRTVVEMPGKPDAQQLRKVVATHPEIGQWVLWHGLSTDLRLSPAQQAIAAEQMRRNQPIIIHGKSK